MKLKYFIFFLLVFIQYIWDRATTYCNTIEGEILLIIHHFIAIFALIGWYYNPFYHLILLTIIGLSWLTINNDTCLLSTVNNKMCGWNKNTEFKSFLVRFKISKIHNHIQKFIGLGLIIYDIIYLIKYVKKSNKNNIYNILSQF
jgi:hypothetical protein|tara:strand:- start:134 stop:565 length:432 start_codon:yes stop_codon:yes gene_type:complete